MGNAQGRLTQNPEKPQAEDEEAEVGKVSTFTCEICIETMLSNKKFKNGNRCVHPFCTNCMIKYTQVKVEDSLADVKCPALNCEHLLDPLFFRPIIPAQLFDSWCDVLCDKALLGFDRCYCPNRDCSALVVNECGGSVRRSKCPNCKKMFCFQCKLSWHAGYRCEESGEMRDRNDIEFGVLVERRKWMRCPQCNHCIELIEGCAIVKCRCGTSFCYRCGRKVNHHWCDCNRNSRCCIWFSRICPVFVIILLLYFLLGDPIAWIHF
ncbi:hypothetical protein F0562_020534 [Nyssa sinensis]|uniref:RBR-type E3 ubiquitin transferase n=1 Tax=Nyssa sinensis TaxID=561372 RepID=A0A5J5BSL9_9ASTE|nr:hypothetical protein F0562_020534 [Nyssa sinensis]